MIWNTDSPNLAVDRGDANIIYDTSTDLLYVLGGENEITSVYIDTNDLSNHNWITEPGFEFPMPHYWKRQIVKIQ